MVEYTKPPMKYKKNNKCVFEKKHTSLIEIYTKNAQWSLIHIVAAKTVVP